MKAGRMMMAVGMLICMGAAPVSASEPVSVAGVNPSQRPAGAPVISKFNNSKEWYANALKGVSKPFPPSLVFLEQQGGWFTPFSQPGMVGKYDLRQWHQK